MITKDKVTEIFCIIDEFDKNLDGELKKNLHLPNQNGNGKRYRNRKGRLSESEVMTILICYHFGTYRNFKEYYQNCIRGCFHKEFPNAVSYNRFVELMPRVFCKKMLFMITGCWSVFTKVLYGKVFANRVFMSKNQSS